MYRNTLLLMSLLMCGLAAGPATARVADQSFFALWNMKVAGPQGSTLQRLPCRQAPNLCARKGKTLETRKRLGKVDPFANRLARKTKRVRRTKATTTTRRMSFAAPGSGGSLMMMLSASGPRRLEVDLAQPQTTADNVESLRHYLGKRAVRRPQAPALVAALGGVGDSAYGTLYNFDDENGGDTLRTLPELPTVLAASPVVVAAAVAEPNALALLALGLVVGWRRTRRGRATALTPRFA
ncbi:MAG: hypothetical protein K2Y51_05305 [Gammaproteobacteria bacterium]|nr:hypothetical protein [Gammaproteobacteria bacterium]